MEPTNPAYPAYPDGPPASGKGRGDARTLDWSRKQIGSFSGIDYSEDGAANGLDPYFVWADISGFAHLRKPGQDARDLSHIPRRLPMLVVLQEGVTARDFLRALQPGLAKPTANTSQHERHTDDPMVSVPEAYLASESVPGGVIPATISRGFFEVRADRELAKFVRRFEIDLPQEATLALSALENDPKPVKRPLLEGKVIALIDDGCAFAHPHFLTPAAAPGFFSARVKRLWDMNPRGPQSMVGPPWVFAAESYAGEYGRDFSDVELDALIASRTYSGRIDEDAVYADFAKGTLDNVNRLQRRSAHGTHVMDMATGPYFVQDTMCTRTGGIEPQNPTWQTAQTSLTEGGGQNASDAQIIFVQLPMRTVQDTSGRNTMTKDVIDALTYILSQCADDTQIVVNLSWGALAGPHDGGHALEQHLDALIASQRALHPMLPPMPAGMNRLQITTPAGNGYQSRTHAYAQLKPGDSQLLQWRTEPDDATESYMEIWLSDDLEVELVVSDPFGNVFPAVTHGQVQNLTGYQAPLQPGSILGVCYNGALLNGQNGHCVLLALAPTCSFANTRPTAPHGIWRVWVVNTGNCEGIVDAYIERDDVALGTRRGARQSYFEDKNYDRQAVEDNQRVDLECPNPHLAYVRREGIFNNISTGLLTEKVGGLRETDAEFAEYSPNGFSSGSTKRPGTATPVPHFATTEESRTLRGIRAAGTRAAGSARLSGTSSAAPQIARDLFNALP